MEDSHVHDVVPLRLQQEQQAMQIIQLRLAEEDETRQKSPLQGSRRMICDRWGLSKKKCNRGINDKRADAITRLVAFGIKPKYDLAVHDSDGVGYTRVKSLIVQNRKRQANRRIPVLVVVALENNCMCGNHLSDKDTGQVAAFCLDHN